MSKTLLIATRRKGKLKEFKEILKTLKFKLLTLKDINFPKIEPKESGKTLAENAVIKAKFYGQKAGLLTLADDTGLWVKALPTKLGVKTKRYAQGTDIDRYQKLLDEMQDVPEKKRVACFISSICLFDPRTGKLNLVQGVCQGKIAHQAKGKYGFGFDPVFVVKNLNKHFAELSLEEKNKISHRAKALKKIIPFLKNEN